MMALTTHHAVPTARAPYIAQPAFQFKQQGALCAQRRHSPRLQQRDRQRMQTSRALPPLSLSLLGLVRRSLPPEVADARDDLLAQLASPRPDVARIDQLVALLTDEKWQLPFREADLAGGPCRPVYTSGLQLWKLWTGPSGKLLRSGNKASQDFIPSSRTVINAGQVLGAALRVTAQGTYETVGDAKVLPQLIKASVAEGALLWSDRRLPLPIRGSGLVYLAYLDQELRIFRTPGGSVSVQLREAAIPRLLGDEWA